MPTIVFCLFFILTLSAPVISTAGNQWPHRHHRHILHQPFFPLNSDPPVHSPSFAAHPPGAQPKHPSSTTPANPQGSFFPAFAFPSSSQPPPPPPQTALATFPANISSLLLPHSPSPAPHRRVFVAVLVSILSAAAVLAAVSAFLLHRHRRGRSLLPATKNPSSADSLRLYPPGTAQSDSASDGGGGGMSRKPLNHSSEFLYLGTLVNSRAGPASDGDDSAAPGGGPRISTSYQKLGSPELKPLPPLPRQNFHRKTEAGSTDNDEEEEFFSPGGSSPGRHESSSRRMLNGIEAENFGSRSFNSRTASYPYSNSISPANTASSLSPRSPKPRAPPARSLSSSSLESNSKNTQNSPSSTSTVRAPIKLPPPPPPPPPPRFWEKLAPPVSGKPPALTTPSRTAAAFQDGEGEEKSEETPKPKLKPLHWDKVRASSERAMVWDQLKTSSFQLNEEMIETLFTVNTANLGAKDNFRRQILPTANQGNRVLDPKKSQNIAILLRALNVTIDEVCEALLEGNADTLGTELLESLLKMAPTKEEERMLKEFKDESPFKLGPAEKFLKALLDIPFAFKRVDAMLYIANFDSEVEYLRRSFETLEAACEELRNSRMFLKLLEAVLKTGNRMNDGTNRGDAHAFKLDTLLKLVDIKGTDGKTTLLHFVVQEIIRAEGYRLSGTNRGSIPEESEKADLREEVEFRKLGLQVVSGLSGELSSVKKAAAMDSDVLSSEVSKLASGVAKIGEVIKLNDDVALKDSGGKFSDSVKGFLRRAEEEITNIQARERTAFSHVKEITEYFHGNLAKEEAHPLRIFMVVRDFLATLDNVCKEVGKINDRTIVSSARPFALPVYQNQPPVFPGFNNRLQYGSSEDEG